MDATRIGELEVIADYRRITDRSVRTYDRLSTGERASEAKDDPRIWRDAQDLKGYADILSGFSDNLNRGASSVRVALDSMEASRQHLLQLEEKLNAAFAELPGSEGRAENLREFNELHGYINDSARAPDAGARRILDDPLSYAEAGDVKIRAGENGFSITLRSREIHAGANGLDIPLAGEPRPSERVEDPTSPSVIADIENATNAEIQEMIAILEDAKATLTAKTKALAVDATSIEQAQDFNEAFIQRNINQAREINVVDLNAEAALANSLQIKNSLAIEGLGGLKDSYRLALTLFRDV